MPLSANSLPPIKVSVSILTYNHKKYIAQALESVLMQEVNFPIEILVGDDCSTDGTQDILREYKAKYPKVIRLFLHQQKKEGIPGRLNNINNLSECKGKYIALLDGDDYWLCKEKLQKQVDYLDHHHTCALSFHDAILKIENSSSKINNIDLKYSEKYNYPNGKQVYSHEDLAQKSRTASSSVLFRKKNLTHFPKWFYKIYSADFALQLMITKHGNAKYFSDIYSVHRLHPKSVTNTLYAADRNNKSLIDEIKIYQRVFSAYKRLNRQGNNPARLAKLCRKQSIIEQKRHNVLGFIKYRIESYLRHYPFLTKDIKHFFRMS